MNFDSAINFCCHYLTMIKIGFIPPSKKQNNKPRIPRYVIQKLKINKEIIDKHYQPKRAVDPDNWTNMVNIQEAVKETILKTKGEKNVWCKWRRSKLKLKKSS